jgi:hypothetical protein
MDDTRIPWWLIVLLWIGVTGLAVWQSSHWKRQLRIGAGLLGLIYLGLLVYTIGGDPRPGAAPRAWVFLDLVKIGLGGLAFLSAALLLGRPGPRGQLVWFGLLSTANAVLCLVVGMPVIAAVLGVTAASSFLVFAVECQSGERWDFGELWPMPVADDRSDVPEFTWLSGLSGIVLAVALVGSIYYALHSESARASPTRRHSAFPSRTRVRTSLNIPVEAEPTASMAERFTSRPEILLLLATLGFLSLSTTWLGIRASVRSQDQPRDLSGPVDGLEG